MLMPSVTMMRPIAAKAAEARPALDPESIQWRMMSIGFHKAEPYTGWAAAAVKMPKRPTTVKMKGMTMTWTFWALGLLAYREKSAMLRPRVA